MAAASIVVRPRRTRGLTAVLAILATVAALGLPVVEGWVTSPASPDPVRGATPVAQIDPAVRTAFASADEVGVVVRAPGAAAVAARDAVTGAGGTVGMDLPIIEGFAAGLTAEGLEALEGIAGVTVSLDGEVRLEGLGCLLCKDKDSDSTDDGSGSTTTTPADSVYVETIGADDLHAKGYTGKGVGIAIIDTGVTEVTDLGGRIVGALDLAADGDHVDHYGHGTFLAGVAAGSGASSNGEHAGVAPGAHIIPVKITGIDGSSDVSHLLAAIQYVVSFKDEYGIGVLNLSLGTNSSQSYTLDPLNYAVEKAWDAGIVVVVSGANLGPNSKTIAKPADDPLVITVGAVDAKATSDRADDTMPDFSSRGPTKADGLQKPDLVAPGASVVGLRAPDSYVDRNYPDGRIGDHYFRATGTSFATAAVSGAVALLREAKPTWTPNQIKGALLSTAAAGPVGDRNVDGHGSIDVHKASTLSKPKAANANVTRSLGTGLIDLSRGDLQVKIEVKSLLGTVLKLVKGEYTAQDLLFDSIDYTTTEWSKSSWYDTDWYKSSWYKSSWYDTDWYKSSWYAANWY